MEKEKLPPIPTPVSQRWREFRIQILPFVVFLGILFGIAYLWKTYVQPIGVVGAAETNLVNVTCLQDGLISELYVERFQMVTNGQIIAQVVNTDPELVRAQIESVQADIKILKVRNQVDEQRTDQAYREMRNEHLSLQVEQAKARVDWGLASNDFRRVEQSFKQKLIPEQDLDAAKAKLDVYSALIETRERQIADLEKSIVDLAPKSGGGLSDAFEEATVKKARELELMLKPNTLRAPIDGMVSTVYHVPGERIIRGMPIVSISDPVTRRVIGYIRQPVTQVPTTNDFVQIMTRTQPRESARARILKVAAQMEPINPLLLGADAKRVEVGLPILVEVPSGLRLLPGEYVNLVIEPARATTTASTAVPQ